jgi:hypothetical protein
LRHAFQISCWVRQPSRSKSQLESVPTRHWTAALGLWGNERRGLASAPSFRLPPSVHPPQRRCGGQILCYTS